MASYLSESQQMRMIMEKMTLREGTYWGNNGKFEKEANELEKLVPGSGPAETLRGEIMRAATKIYYDYHNNGFGNTWGEALLFLDKYAYVDPTVYNFLEQYAGGDIHGNPGGSDDHFLETMMDSAVQYALTRVDPKQPTPHDMWDTPGADQFTSDDYEDEDEYDYQDDDDEY